MKQQLRLALGMRGGVSLAVWIGGAGAEIDRLCRADPGFWRDVLDASDYGEVIVDVIAGASAGGLNGVLLAASQQYGYRLDRVRDLWLEVGGIASLVRTPTTKGDPAPSLLDGDRRFLQVVHDEIAAMVGAPDTQRPLGRPRVDLQLSATLVEPIARRVRSPLDEDLTERRSAARFSFRHDTGLGGTDFPYPPERADDDPEAQARFDAAIWRLALAARATSSYPVAFEAAYVRSTRAPSFAAPKDDTPTCGPLVEMRGVFSDRQRPSQPLSSTQPAASDFVVADGGILDNIPLGKAIRAVQQAPADRPTGRVLVYLHPGSPAHRQGPDAGGAGERDPEHRRSSISVLGGVLKAVYESESIAGDIAELEAHNERVARARVLRQGTFADIADRSQLLAAARHERQRYRQHRNIHDAGLVCQLLDDPAAALGDDRFPIIDGVTDSRWRSPLAYWSGKDREEFESRLVQYFDDRFAEVPSTSDEGDAVLAAGLRPLVRIGQLLIEWARLIEQREGQAAGDVKAKLYRVLSFVETALERPRRMAWVKLAVADGTGDGDWVAETAVAADSLLIVGRDEADRLVAALLADDDGPLHDFTRATCARLDGKLERRDGVDIRPAIVAGVLARYAEELRLLPTRPDRERASETSDDRAPASGESPEAVLLDRVLQGEDPIDVATLVALEIVCFPEFVAGAPGQRRIEFVRLSAANRTPVAAWFVALRDIAIEKGLRWEPTTPLRWIPSFPPGHPYGFQAFPFGIHIKLKLAGNELANFAAFLRPEWRANDWMWGRLDAVPTLVDLLLTPASLHRWLHGKSGQEALDEVRRLVVGAAVGSVDLDGLWRDWLVTEVWPLYAEQIVGELEALGLQGELDPNASVDAIRNAVITRRQWEILADELAKPVERAIDGRGVLDPSAAFTDVAGRTVGAESLTEPKRQDTVEAFQQLSESAARAINWNARTLRTDRQGTIQSPAVIERAAGWAARAVHFGGPLAAGIAFGPSGSTTRFAVSNWAPVLAVVTIAGLVIWAVLESWLAVVLTLAAVVLAVVATALLVRKLSGRRRPAPPGEPAAPSGR